MVGYQNLVCFGKEYIIPKPTDPRLIVHVAPAVARAAMDTGVAKKPVTDWDNYHEELSKRLGISNPLRLSSYRLCPSLAPQTQWGYTLGLLGPLQSPLMTSWL